MAKRTWDPRCERMVWLCSEFDYRHRQQETHVGTRDVMEFIEEAQAAVGCGQPLEVPGTWPMNIRQLYQDQDFHFKGRAIFKKKDPCAAALDGNAGLDIADADELTILHHEQQMVDNACDFDEAVRALEGHPQGAEIIEELQKLNVDYEDAMFHAQSLNDDETMSDDEADDQEAESIGLLEALDTVGLNSAFCARGYRAPRDSYEFVYRQERHDWEDKAYERRILFGDLKAELVDITDEGTLNMFLERIRDDYYEDKRIRSLWNAKAWAEDKALYVEGLRKRGLDEEAIRRKLWGTFDNSGGRKPAVYKDGKLVRLSRTSRPCLWMKFRSNALQELTLTTAQWAKVYELARACRQRCREIAREAYQARRAGNSVLLQKLAKTLNEINCLKDFNVLKPQLILEQHELNKLQRAHLWKITELRQKVLAKLPKIAREE